MKTMEKTDRYNVQDVVQSLSDSIQHKLVKPSENKFVSLLEKTREDIDNRTSSSEEQINARLEELSGVVKELHQNQKRMGILCLTLSLAVVISIVLQII